MNEIDKYRNAYKDQDYKMCGSRYEHAITILDGLKCGTLIDVGCGRGEVVDLANRMGFSAVGYEAVEYLCDGSLIMNGMLPNVACQWNAGGEIVPIMTWEIVTCLDVLEHVEPEITEDSIRNLRAICTREAFITISTIPDEDKDGVQLHINIREPIEWHRLLKKYFTIVEMLNKSTSYGPTPFRCYV